MALRVPNSKYFRYRLHSRLRYGRRMKSFLTDLGTIYSATATPNVVTPVRTTNTKAELLVTIAGLPLNNDTITIDAVVYTFKTALTPAAYEVLIGAAATNTRDNLAAAIMAGAGSGTTYGAGTLVHPSVTAASSGANLLITAKLEANLQPGWLITVSESATNITIPAAGRLDGPAWTATAHNFTEGEGPALLTNSGGALPTGSPAAGTELFVHVIDANTVAFATNQESLREGNFIQTTSAGTGTHSATRSVAAKGLFDALKRSRPRTLAAGTDIDAV